jgi:hypothetical protein
MQRLAAELRGDSAVPGGRFYTCACRGATAPFGAPIIVLGVA